MFVVYLLLFLFILVLAYVCVCLFGYHTFVLLYFLLMW